MSQATTATTTTPPVTFVCCSTSSLTVTVTMAPTLMGLPVTLGQHDVDLLAPLMLRDTGSVVGLNTVLQQLPQSQVSCQAYANYAMDPLQVSFSSQIEPFTDLLIYVSVCCGVYFLLLGTMLGAQPLGFHHCSPLNIFMAGICASWW